MIDAAYLKQIHDLAGYIKRLPLQISQMKDDACGIHSIVYTERVQTSRKLDCLSNKVIDYCDKENKYLRCVEQFIELYTLLYRTIKDFDLEQQLFLSMYCFEGKSYEQISQEMNISESTVFRLRRDALVALQNEGKVSV